MFGARAVFKLANFLRTKALPTTPIVITGYYFDRAEVMEGSIEAARLGIPFKMLTDMKTTTTVRKQWEVPVQEPRCA